MIDQGSLNRFFMFSAFGIIGGGAFAKFNNKNIFLGAGLGFVVAFGANYALYKSEKIIKNAKVKKEADLTKNMTQEQKNQYVISQGGKAKVSL